MTRTPRWIAPIAFVFFFCMLSCSTISDLMNGTQKTPEPLSGATAAIPTPAPKPSPSAGPSHPPQMAFISWRESPDDWINDIYLVQLDGTNLTKVTDGAGIIESITWSPDGSQIAFNSDRDGGDDYEIYVINADGSGLRQVTNDSAWDQDLAWSPDGKRLAFSSDRDGEPAIYTMALDGSDLKKLSDAGRTPAWSPDGSQIAFAVIFDGIYVMNADGSGKTRLTDSSERGWDWFPRWSPDGKWILFASNPDHPGDAAYDAVYRMNADGSGIVGLYIETIGQPPYSWSPDGTSIAFVQGYFSAATIFLMNADGSNVRPLMAENNGFHPVWRP